MFQLGWSDNRMNRVLTNILRIHFSLIQESNLNCTSKDLVQSRYFTKNACMQRLSTILKDINGKVQVDCKKSNISTINIGTSAEEQEKFSKSESKYLI